MPLLSAWPSPLETSDCPKTVEREGGIMPRRRPDTTFDYQESLADRDPPPILLRAIVLWPFSLPFPSWMKDQGYMRKGWINGHLLSGK